MSPKYFIVYEDTTGKIIRRGKCHPDAVSAQASETGESSLETLGLIDADTNYVSSSVVTSRASNPATLSGSTIIANGVDTLTLSNIPNPTTVKITGPISSEVEVTDGTLDITVDEPGAYTLFLDSFPTQDKELSFDAT